MQCFLTLKHAICKLQHALGATATDLQHVTHKPTLCSVVNLQHTVATDQLGLQMANSVQRPRMLVETTKRNTEK